MDSGLLGCPRVTRRRARRLEVAVDDEGFDLPVARRRLEGHALPSPRRRAGRAALRGRGGSAGTRPRIAPGCRDLGGRHLVDEAQDDGRRRSPVRRSVGLPGRGRAASRSAIVVSRSDGSGVARARSKGASGRRRERRRRSATTLRAIRNARCGTSRRRPLVRAGPLFERGNWRARTGTSAPWRLPPRGGRRARRPLVVHLCHVLPIERVEARGVGPAASTSERSRSSRARRGVAALSGRVAFLNAGQAIALHQARAATGEPRRTCAISPTNWAPVDHQRAESMSTPVARTAVERPSESMRSTSRPVVTWRLAQPGPSNRPSRRSSRPSLSRSRMPRAGRCGRSAGRRARAVTSSRRRARRKPARGQSPFADPDHGARIWRTDPIGLAE